MKLDTGKSVIVMLDATLKQKAEMSPETVSIQGKNIDLGWQESEVVVKQGDDTYRGIRCVILYKDQ
ncbi:MAG TPA: hypothetical protein VJ248_02140 [Candidatus Udaeobacter sp.]|nr:hypothetical protein [Candidatus Udaeobacter sp.]